MEFWGVEVKPGETVKCKPGYNKYLHISQASLGEVKDEKDNEDVPIYLTIDEQKLVIGTLSTRKCPQITYDLVLEKEFEVSHSCKNGSVFFVGYQTEISDEGPYDFPEFTDSESEEEEIPTLVPVNGKPTSENELAKTKVDFVKADSVLTKSSAKSEGDSDKDEILSDEDESNDEDMLDGEDDTSDEEEDDESSEEEDEPSPKKVENGKNAKKRAAGSPLKTPTSNKKAKMAVVSSARPKGGHTATPHPANQASKTTLATRNEQSKKQPKPRPGGPAKAKSSRSKPF